jgi:alpha-glucosidase
LPYIYSLFYDASQTGMPVQRSLAINYSHDPRVYNGLYHNQYLFGPNILVAPVESNKELLKVFFPPGEWYDLYTGRIWQGNQETVVESPIHKLPVFVKAGSVLPMQPAASHTGIKHEELILHIYCGRDSSDFLLYSDDGETFDYQKGQCSKRLIQMIGSENRVVLSPCEGNYKPHFKKIKFVLHGTPANTLTVNANSMALDRLVHSYFSLLEKYDPINEPDSMGEEDVKVAVIEYVNEKIEISW